ncbi:protein eva-1 homolog B isoform X1 [Hirundo rustica]|nr:protein eva-1 homolog B isoform X1 [Hirundo rustica]
MAGHGTESLARCHRSTRCRVQEEPYPSRSLRKDGGEWEREWDGSSSDLWGSSPGRSSPAQARTPAQLELSEEPLGASRHGLERDRGLGGIPAPYRALLSPCPTDAEHVPSLEPLRTARSRMESRRRDMELLSNSMAAYAHIRANPESFGLYFVLGVCFGLVLTLCLLVLRLSCRLSPRPPERPGDLSEDDEDEDEDEEDTVDRAASESLLPVTEIPLESHGPGDGALAVNVFASAEELERAQRLEERERIIREIWRNGQPDILGSGTIGTLGRVHYY